MGRKKAKPPAEPLAAAIDAAAAHADQKAAGPPREERLSTGCTLLNLAISGKASYGITKGTYLWLVGDSSSGKTWFSFTCLAEAARSRHFDGHRFVFDNAENGALMDTTRYFGQGVTDRLEPPLKDADDNPVYSANVQDFYFNVDHALDQGPCIYILDSMDALGEESGEEKFEAEKTNYLGGSAKVPGSMGMQKAKANSQNINRVVRRLRETGSILIIISQNRSKVGGHIPNQKTYAGGFAMRFYAHCQVWTTPKGPIKKTVRLEGQKAGVEREVGATIGIDIQKNRFSGWEGKVEVPFYRSHGIDDLGSCVNWLIEEKFWGKPAKKDGTKPDDESGGGSAQIAAPEFDFTGKPEALIAKIEAEDREQELRKLVGQHWAAIEAASAPKRKPRYT